MAYGEVLVRTGNARPINVLSASYEEWIVDGLTVERFAEWAGVELDDVMVVWRDDYVMEFHAFPPTCPDREIFVEGDLA